MHVRTSTRPLRARHARALVDGRHPQNDADAGATARSPRAGDAAEGTPAGGRGRGHYDLRAGNGVGSLDVSRAVARARRHSARHRERGVRGRERTGGRGRGAGGAGTSTYGNTKPRILTTSKSVPVR